jgi:hypothetical protein
MKPEWIDEWTGPDHKFEHDEDAISWIRSRPDSIKELMLKFPPSCVVKSDIPLHTADDQYGILSSYAENGQVSIRAHPDGGVRGFVDPKHLTVVGYWGGVTSDVIKGIIND